MAGWLGRLVGGGGTGGAQQGRLRRLLKDYPPYRQPHPGPGSALTLPQAEANLAYLRDNKSARLAIVGGVLSQFALNLDEGLAAADPQPYLKALGQWTARDWPALRDTSLLTIDTWLNSRREGPEIVFSLIMDIAIVLAEIVLRRRNDYRWALDLDPQNAPQGGKDGMLSWQRPVVLRPADGIVPVIQFDFEDAVRTAYIQCGKPGYNLRGEFGRGVLDAISGAHETWWRQQAAARPG
jgi:hypothetical protein